jgi:hypothetical protein
MPALLLLLISVAMLLGVASAHATRPDDPGARVPANRYAPIISGTKSYRPVQPLPWGDVNRRVAPKEQKPSSGSAPKGKGAAPQPAPQHHH